ncbi:YceI family protein [Brevibacterium sp. GP-SGM9]|uniref:YceI family protein n=1 Tax=Brevibacterium sp. GP-SGM9 TaxID=3376990 RepID=UPI0039A56401
MSEGTGTENRDAHLRSADFFNVETYSEIQYVSSAIVDVDLGSYIGSDDLTIRDMTKTVAIPLEFERRSQRVQHRWPARRTGRHGVPSLAAVQARRNSG